jgi:mono/diheme cytochrome c family protein
VTEVPDYLLERSRNRRVALGLLSDDGGSSGGGGEAGGGGAATAAAAGPSTADLIAAAKSAAKLEPEPEAPADPEWVEAARSRRRIPMWVLPILFFLPVWGFVYVKLTEPAPETITALTEGATTYGARCAACHVGDGSGTDGGGVGRPLWQGEILLTFPELDDSMIEWLAIGTNGIGVGNVYGDPDRPGGAHVAGEFGGAMPGFGEQLSEYQIYSVARYIREVLGGEELSGADEEARDAEWEALGGGRDTGGGGGGGH